MAALIYHGLPDLNWAGFYFRQGDELVLGPFQGKPACVRIPWGQGVCGTAAARGAAVMVPDVHEFPGHIACDAASRSELVVPLRHDGDIIGVLDSTAPSPPASTRRTAPALSARRDPACVGRSGMTACAPFARRARDGGSRWNRRFDLFHRLLDHPGRAWRRAGGARLRLGVGGRAFAYPGAAPDARRYRAGETLLRRDGPVRDLDRRRLRDKAAQDRDRHRAGDPARHDPDREAGRLDRPGLGRPLSSSASAAAGTRRRSKTTAPSSRRACRRCASRWRR